MVYLKKVNDVNIKIDSAILFVHMACLAPSKREVLIPIKNILQEGTKY